MHVNAPIDAVLGELVGYSISELLHLAHFMERLFDGGMCGAKSCCQFAGGLAGITFHKAAQFVHIHFHRTSKLRFICRDVSPERSRLNPTGHVRSVVVPSPNTSQMLRAAAMALYPFSNSYKIQCRKCRFLKSIFGKKYRPE